MKGPIKLTTMLILDAHHRATFAYVHRVMYVKVHSNLVYERKMLKQSRYPPIIELTNKCGAVDPHMRVFCTHRLNPLQIKNVLKKNPENSKK